MKEDKKTKETRKDELTKEIERLKKEISDFETQVIILEDELEIIETISDVEEKTEYKNVVMETEIILAQKQLKLLKSHPLLNAKKIKEIKEKLTKLEK